MSIVPVVTARLMVQTLSRAGFVVVRQIGSHLRLLHPLTRRGVTIPMHAGDLSRKIMSSILRQAGMSVSKFLNLLKK